MFYKYQGTGNDFVMIDNRTKTFPKEKTAIFSQLSDRNFGIGADGIILIENDEEFDFKMIYYNADGSETFCGNGARCAVAFAKQLEIIDQKTKFIAVDGPHFAQISQGIQEGNKIIFFCLSQVQVLSLTIVFTKILMQIRVVL